jgi:hypothetical protein
MLISNGHELVSAAVKRLTGHAAVVHQTLINVASGHF